MTEEAPAESPHDRLPGNGEEKVQRALSAFMRLNPTERNELVRRLMIVGAIRGERTRH